jgi:hypothetical protein
LREGDWEFSKDGKEYLQDYLKKLAQKQDTTKK